MFVLVTGIKDFNLAGKLLQKQPSFISSINSINFFYKLYTLFFSHTPGENYFVTVL